MTSMFVYVLSDFRGSTKVGISVDPLSRLRAFQTGLPHKLHLVLALPVRREDARRYERDIHFAYGSFRLSGEWFSGDPVVIARHVLDLCRIAIPNGRSASTPSWPALLDASDPLEGFLSQCTRPTIGARVAVADVHDLYAAWAKGMGHPVLSKKGLAIALRDRGYRSKKSGRMYVLDVVTTSTIDDLPVPPKTTGILP